MIVVDQKSWLRRREILYKVIWQMVPQTSDDSIDIALSVLWDIMIDMFIPHCVISTRIAL
jgi:hypothetical protein